MVVDEQDLHEASLRGSAANVIGGEGMNDGPRRESLLGCFAYGLARLWSIKTILCRVSVDHVRQNDGDGGDQTSRVRGSAPASKERANAVEHAVDMAAVAPSASEVHEAVDDWVRVRPEL